jgi:hypothetical protein
MKVETGGDGSFDLVQEFTELAGVMSETQRLPMTLPVAMSSAANRELVDLCVVAVDLYNASCAGPSFAPSAVRARGVLCMLYVDIPTLAEIRALHRTRAPTPVCRSTSARHRKHST